MAGWESGVDTATVPAYAQRAMKTFDLNADENSASNCGSTVMAALGEHWTGVYLAPDYIKDDMYGQGRFNVVWSAEALQYISQHYYGGPADVFYAGDAGTIQYYLRQFLRVQKACAVLVNNGTASSPVAHWFAVLRAAGPDDDHTDVVTPYDPWRGRIYDGRAMMQPWSKKQFNEALYRLEGSFSMVGFHRRRSIDVSTALWS